MRRVELVWPPKAEAVLEETGLGESSVRRVRPRNLLVSDRAPTPGYFSTRSAGPFSMSGCTAHFGTSTVCARFEAFT